MKLPRDVDGNKLAKKLIRLGFHSMHQTGSHIVIQPPQRGQQPIGIPAHRNLKTGMLHRHTFHSKQPVGPDYRGIGGSFEVVG